MKLSPDYYLDQDVVHLARSFLGKILVSCFENKLTAGIITETEAYAGINDKASHAYGDRYTRRTAPMYEEGGIAYVYLIYGMYSLFNIVTAPKGIPHAVLVRGIHPQDGINFMEERRGRPCGKGFSDGPGKLSSALGIHYSESGVSLQGNRIWIEDRKVEVEEKDIIVGPRVGIDYAAEDTSLPYRFRYNKKGHQNGGLSLKHLR